MTDEVMQPSCLLSTEQTSGGRAVCVWEPSRSMTIPQDKHLNETQLGKIANVHRPYPNRHMGMHETDFSIWDFDYLEPGRMFTFLCTDFNFSIQSVYVTSSF